MSPRKSTRRRQPAAHQRPYPNIDPTDPDAPVLDRLLAGRAKLTAALFDYEQTQDPARRARQRTRNDPLLRPDAPHNVFFASQSAGNEAGHIQDWLGEQTAEPDEDEDDEAVERWMRSTPTTTIALPGGMTEAVVGPDPWYRLRWKPQRRFDDRQRHFDRFELGANAWKCIKTVLRTERQFGQWVISNGAQGVLFAAESADGRLAEPAAIRVVVSGRLIRRVAIWSLWLPNPRWNAEVRRFYVAERSGGNENWQALTLLCDDTNDNPNLATALYARRATHTARRRHDGSPDSKRR